jgi:hypothetical protein
MFRARDSDAHISQTFFAFQSSSEKERFSSEICMVHPRLEKFQESNESKSEFVKK